MVVARKALIAVGVLVVIGVVVGIIINFTSGGDNENANTRTSGKSLTNTVRDRTPDVSESDLLTNSTSNSSGSTFYEPESDPEEAKVALTMIAIGDWGATTDKPGSCCNKYRKVANDSLEMKIDYWSQINIAELMAQAASDIKPLRIIGHGDNIYWNGAGPGDIEYRMETTFESVYDQPELKGIPWINVVGNHDLGGSEYICGDKDYNFRECKSTEELLKYLNLKFTLQQKYKSANSDRWKLSDHYYVESVKANGVSVDIFNIDTNFADSHGVMQICCQCYGYVKKKDLSAAEAKKLGSTCNDRIPGDELCAGGNIEMYNACADTIKSWWDDSLKQVKRDLMASTATWKVINSHYSPHFHMSEDKMKEWFLITKEGGAHVWLNGHTHGFNHDISNWGTHFYENGGGGGIQSETSGMPPMVAKKYVKHAWIAAGNPYGFFMLHFSEDWLKTEFVTFDNSWTFSINKDEIVKGGYQKVGSSRSTLAQCVHHETLLLAFSTMRILKRSLADCSDSRCDCEK
ncbi:calcineurinlike phosphoesterase [Plasmopara halstedii]|uniref:Calcineurinlike phosphoesterase n=1 Tax=Plasmopara halstedii TaxID=4781 RepID=A0A0N7L478_PLAHL|nr:calcineurinlike phosphoesterase [Plasmopara halstedii]CEG37915.1 calcineurinlike phosphoesterase [Plasmopara halstedii]|eukprot:XP_024574284.1 calcineurinlike phosphoesterase [Plasmopara halstedii]